MEPVKTTQITSVWTYLETVDWSDPWFAGLLVFHLLTLLITFVTRNRQLLQAVYFVILLMLVYFAESLNEMAARHYKLFSRQQYFDSKGMFISLVWSAPLLMNCLIILMIWIVASSQLMVATGKLKMELEKKNKDKEKKHH